MPRFTPCGLYLSLIHIWEGGRALGLAPYAVYRCVILPQAIRLVLPPLTGLAISLIKHSALVSVIAVADLTTEGRNLIADTFMTFELWFTVAVLYLISVSYTHLDVYKRQAGNGMR